MHSVLASTRADSQRPDPSDTEETVISRSTPRGPDHEPAGLVATSIEHHPDIPRIGPLAGSFTWDLPDDRWWWSEEMFVIHGFAPGEVVPTTDLLLLPQAP